jgi:predicted acyl esterase
MLSLHMHLVARMTHLAHSVVCWHFSPLCAILWIGDGCDPPAEERAMRRFDRTVQRQPRSKRITRDVTLERDVSVRMSDGVQLVANVFHSFEPRRAPVVMSVTPYGKDTLPDRRGMLFMRLSGVRFGQLDCSAWTGFEAPDPLFWVRAGYTVVQADVRGMHKSEGHASVLSDRDAADYYELIEWAASQSWSTGAVGLLGVSYLAMSQWRVAALRPPSLGAICPWEGVTDLLRELGYQDGVPETGFVGLWWRFRMQAGHNKRFPMSENFPADRDQHPLDAAYWQGKRPALEHIRVPALVCASWSDQGLHTRGSLEGFERIASAHKWLYTHGGRKWETFYSPEAREVQRRFFDHFLKGEPNGWEATPRVRLAVRRSREVCDIREASAWPLAEVTYVPLYLDAVTWALTTDLPVTEGVRQYDPHDGPGDRATFLYRFEHEAELTGTMTLSLWVSTSEGDDLDLFVLLRKIDATGKEVCFYGYNGFADDGVAKGWLRVSHRALDPQRSRRGRPWHTHRQPQPVQPDEIVPVEIEVLASSTLFEAGSRLCVQVLGHDAARYPAFAHDRSVNRGTHAIHTGGRYPSALLTPFVNR